MTIVISFVCASSQAATLYHQSSECTHDANQKPVNVYSLYTDISGKPAKTIEEEAKLRMLGKIQAKMAETGSDYVIKHVSFRYDEDQFVNSYVSILPVKSCENGIVINEKYAHRLHSRIINFESNLALDTTTTLKFRSQPHAVSPLSIKNTNVTHNMPFGIALGSHFDSAQKNVGRFSALWPVNDTLKIAFLGRDNAFIFQNDKLTGYQYSRSLLPIDLRNRVELISEQPSFHFVHNDQSQTVQKFIDRQQQASLEKYFNEVQSVNIKVSDDLIRSQLEGLTIGDKLEKSVVVNQMPCFTGQTNIDEFVSKHHSSLLKLIGFNNKVSYITGCSQSIELHHSGKVSSIELFEPISQTNGALYNLNSLLATIQNWSYSDIHYGDNQSVLKQFKTTTKGNGVIEVDSQNWFGIFNVYDQTVASATLYPKAIR
ncbi:hypothetical protein [Pseudoalteromonas sp. MMG022]|uniref:hypothetical protein n=1 Tax=Pseudoalteromonas sp. MMG022 TaxID=2909978 RepID=UPI001F3246E1|nr:hypothetical protein [Pseudoalteromonas sp. MMG022]MCF6434171.1 hypothetical protein [Pseudoalteromonas sp. MMG022]